MDKKEIIVGREFSVRDRTNKFIQSIFPKAPNGLYAFQSTMIGEMKEVIINPNTIIKITHKPKRTGEDGVKVGFHIVGTNTQHYCWWSVFKPLVTPITSLPTTSFDTSISLDKQLTLIQYDILLGDDMIQVGDDVEFWDDIKTREKIFKKNWKSPEHIRNIAWDGRSQITFGKVEHIELDTYFKGLSVIISNKNNIGEYFAFPYLTIKSINGREIDYDKISKSRG